ncbi:MAG: cellulase family glycosylhydrolase [Gammaproteobacteria bacterium]|nr:cellulase family glycosylhydrolase [Gammaproteobacteria bacterium]MBU1776436.1 cellulase family glycosylhydrolase [Gammaproteobacteria bacterium]
MQLGRTFFPLVFLLLVTYSFAVSNANARGNEGDAKSTVSIGVNKFDLFIQYTGTASGGDGSVPYRRVTRAMAKKALDDAKDAGIKFVRVSMSGRTSTKPGDGRDSLDLWRTDPETFWRQVDEMMDDLDARGIQIVPVLMWGTGKFPLMTGEPLGEILRNPQSKSWELLTRFVTDFVSRYRMRNTILFYELTNELNNYADLNLEKRCNKYKEVCEEGDSFTANDMITYTWRFANLVRSLDTTRLISSGFSIPRGSAEHLRKRPEWSTKKTDWRPDSREQFAKNLEEIHAGVDIISIHLYGGKKTGVLDQPTQ